MFALQLAVMKELCLEMVNDRTGVYADVYIHVISPDGTHVLDYLQDGIRVCRMQETYIDGETLFFADGITGNEVSANITDVKDVLFSIVSETGDIEEEREYIIREDGTFFEYVVQLTDTAVDQVSAACGVLNITPTYFNPDRWHE